MNNNELKVGTFNLSRSSLIEASAGTGKTYTVSVLICLLKKINRNLRIGIAAPTGKAAARVKESLNAAFGGLFRNAYEKLYPNLIDEIAPAEKSTRLRASLVVFLRRTGVPVSARCSLMSFSAPLFRFCASLSPCQICQHIYER